MPGTKNGFCLLTKLKVAWGIQINSVTNAMTGNTRGSQEIADAKYKTCLTTLILSVEWELDGGKK